MTCTIMMLFVMALLATGAPVDACEPHKKHRLLHDQWQMEGRSWRVQGYTRQEFRGRDAQGNRLGGTIEKLPSGAFRFKGWTKQSPVTGRVRQFLERRQQ